MSNGNGDQEDAPDTHRAYCPLCPFSATGATEADANLMVQIHIAAAHPSKK